MVEGDTLGALWGATVKIVYTEICKYWSLSLRSDIKPADRPWMFKSFPLLLTWALGHEKRTILPVASLSKLSALP